VAQELYQKSFDKLSAKEPTLVRTDANEWFLTGLMLKQSGRQHDTLRKDLNINFAKGKEEFLKTRQALLSLLIECESIVGNPKDSTAHAVTSGEGTMLIPLTLIPC
jgi:hypothetical protein